MKPPFKMIISNEIEQWRYDTWDTKEPETIAWIDSFINGDVFFDVGANIGIYSLYCAAIHPKCNIIAFEPDKKNYNRLVENIGLNYFTKIFPLISIVSDKTGCMGFESCYSEIGSSGGQMCVEGNYICTSIDSWDCPNHIKIDIDGQELKVVHGMKETLKNKTLKSVLIEIDLDREEIIEIFFDNDFTIDNIFNRMPNHSRVRRAKEGINVENIIFTRREYV
jgi:FkbM family methyltransferase